MGNTFTTTPATPVTSSSPAYLTLAAARALAITLPGLTSFNAAADDVATAALLGASIDIDAAERWQGRKYDATQVLEFPRVARESSGAAAWSSGGAWAIPQQFGATEIWDWDAENSAAVVPLQVKRACLFQADAILAGKLYKALDDQAMGVASKGVGSLSISYRDPAAMLSAIGAGNGTLCRQAAQQMGKFRLTSGRIL